MTSLLKAADHLQIIGLTQTRRSPVNFIPTVISTSGTPTGISEPSPVQPGNNGIGISGGGSSSGGGGGGGSGGEAQQVYSKKARILEQNKNAVAAITTLNHSSTTISNNGSGSSSSNFRDNRERDYEMSVERERLEEQQSPLVTYEWHVAYFQLIMGYFHKDCFKLL
jgi:hypothetical protein